MTQDDKDPRCLWREAEIRMGNQNVSRAEMFAKKGRPPLPKVVELERAENPCPACGGTKPHTHKQEELLAIIVEQRETANVIMAELTKAKAERACAAAIRVRGNK